MQDHVERLWIQKVERGVVQLKADMRSGECLDYTNLLDVAHSYTVRNHNLLVCVDRVTQRGLVLAEHVATGRSRVAVGPTMTLLEAEVAAAHLLG